MNHRNLHWHEHRITKKARSIAKHQKPCLLWLTGLSGSGKSTIANEVESILYEKGKHTYLLDGDNIRSGLNSDLGFNEKDRIENIRRIGEVAKLFVDAGLIVISAFISPFRKEREKVRQLFEKGEFIEVFIDTPLQECERRDVKGLYKKARAGEIPHFSGIDSPYEAPISPEIHISTLSLTVQEAAYAIVAYLEKRGYLHA